MPGEPVHGTVGAADLLPAADALMMILASQRIELAASISGCAEGHHQFLFIERSLEGVGTHIDHGDLHQVFFLKSGIRVNIDFHKTMGIFVLYGFQIRSINNVVVYSTNTFYQTGQLQERDAGETVIGVIGFQCRLQPGQYYVTLGVSQFDERREEIIALDRRMDAFVLTVLGDRHRAQGIVELDLKLQVGTRT